MNTVEALAYVIAEQKQQIDQLEMDCDVLANKATRYMTQFEMTENALKEVQHALRECKESLRLAGLEVAELHKDLSMWEERRV